MPPLKSSLIKPSKSMLFFHIWNANFSVTPINSQMYMTKPNKSKKKISENTGKTFFVIMPSFTWRGWAYLRKLLYFLEDNISKNAKIELILIFYLLGAKLALSLGSTLANFYSGSVSFCSQLITNVKDLLTNVIPL